MKAWRFDAVTQHAADGIDRRAILGLVAGAALTAVIHPWNTGAADNKKKKRRKQRKRCKKDSKTCSSRAIAYCDAYYIPPYSDACKSDILTCCSYYKKCTKKAYRQGNTCNSQILW